MAWLRAGEVAKIEGISRQTVLKRIKDGFYDKLETTKCGHYRIWMEQRPDTILYACSESIEEITQQKESLINKYPKGNFVYDIGTGFNLKRRGFRTILERVINKDPLTIVVSEERRFSEIGIEYFRKLIELSGGKLIVLEERNKTEISSREFINFISEFIEHKSSKE